MNQGKWNVPKEGFSCQPEQDRAVLADGPEHAQAPELPVGFSQNMDASRFQLVQTGPDGA
jgi:hypothetical protein